MGLLISLKCVLPYFLRRWKGIFSKSTPWGYEILRVPAAHNIMGVHIIGFFWSTNLSRILQRVTFAPNWIKRVIDCDHLTFRAIIVSIKIKNTDNIFLGFRIGANFEVPGLGISMMVIFLQKFANNCFVLYILPELACCMVLHRLRHKCHKLLREMRWRRIPFIELV